MKVCNLRLTEFIGVVEDVLNQVSNLRESSVVPKEDDLHGAAVALVRLQDTYLLNVTDLAEGHFYGVEDSKHHGELIFILWRNELNYDTKKNNNMNIQLQTSVYFLIKKNQY